MKAYRTNAYTVRFNDAEQKLIVSEAERRGLEVGSWIRMVSLAAACIDHDEDRRASLATRRAQIARRP
jgi:hypothetical protein